MTMQPFTVESLKPPLETPFYFFTLFIYFISSRILESRPGRVHTKEHVRCALHKAHQVSSRQLRKGVYYVVFSVLGSGPFPKFRKYRCLTIYPRANIRPCPFRDWTLRESLLWKIQAVTLKLVVIYFFFYLILWSQKNFSSYTAQL